MLRVLPPNRGVITQNEALFGASSHFQNRARALPIARSRVRGATGV